MARLIPSSLRALMEMNHGVVAPVLVRYNSMWSNFWGAINEFGYYARSHDYMDIIQNKIQGRFNVPYLTHAYLVKAAVLPNLNYDHESLEPDMAVCLHLRDSVSRKINKFIKTGSNMLNKLFIYRMFSCLSRTKKVTVI